MLWGCQLLNTLPDELPYLRQAEEVCAAPSPCLTPLWCLPVLFGIIAVAYLGLTAGWCDGATARRRKGACRSSARLALRLTVIVMMREEKKKRRERRKESADRGAQTEVLRLSTPLLPLLLDKLFEVPIRET